MVDLADPLVRRRGGRRLSFDREQALEAALRLFWQRGYEGTSVGDLVAEMGITPPSLYAAFGSKEELYGEAVGRYGDTHAGFLLAAIREEPTAYLAVRRVLLESARFYSDADTPVGCMVATAAQYCGPGHTAVAQLLAGKRAAIVDAIEDRIGRDVREGGIADVDARALASFYASVLQGLSVQARDGADLAILNGVVEIAMRAWPHPDAFDA